MRNIIKALQVLNNLRKIKRTGPNLFAGIPDEFVESIAEHSYKVAYLCLIFSQRVKNVGLGQLLVYAIIDEWGESLLGDIPTGSKSYQSYFDTDIRKIFKKAESRIREEVVNDAGVEMPKLNKQEQKLFDFCDLVARILELVDHRQSGFKHKWIDKMYFMQMRLIKEFKFSFIPEVVSELERLYEQGCMDNPYMTKVATELTGDK